MPATAENLRDLHVLQQRAKALRDRLVTGPKTLAARQSVLATKQAALDDARKALQEDKVQVKKHEHGLQGQQAKVEDLKSKRNQVKKNEEYKAIQNQLAHDEKVAEQLENDIIEAMIRVDERTASLAALEADVKKTADQVAQLREFEVAIAEAESIIPIDQRDQYRRNVKQRGADAFASVDIENTACSGCYVSVTPQTINELINCTKLNFCKTCGRILYLDEEAVSATR